MFARFKRQAAISVALAVIASAQLSAFSSAFAAPVAPIASDGTASVIAMAMPNYGSLAFYWNLNGDPTWHRQEVAGPNETFSAPSIARDRTASVIAALGLNNSLAFYWNLN